MISVYQLERDHTIDMKWNMEQQYIHINETEEKTMLDNHTTMYPKEIAATRLLKLSKF